MFNPRLVIHVGNPTQATEVKELILLDVLLRDFVVTFKMFL